MFDSVIKIINWVHEKSNILFQYI
uniref:Uncharacterized protein n=1 Tax=Arundo donax TaxID=35708 RepID=A0A0A9H8P5_ARUDO